MIKIFLCLLRFLICGLPALAFAGNAGEEKDYSIRFEFPFGAGAFEAVTVKGSEVQALLCAESFIHRKIPVQASIELPECLEFLGAEDIELAGRTLHAAFTLRTENDTWYRLVKLRVRPDAAEGKYVITVQSLCDGKASVRTIPCWVISSDYIKKNVRLLRFSIPADEGGKRDLKREANTLSIKDTNSLLLRSLSLGSQKSHDFTFAGAEFENSGEYPVTLNVNYAILNKKTLAPAEWLNNLSDETGVNASGLSSQALLKPHSRETVLFKISGGDKDMPPGEYLQRLSAGLLSSGKEILAAELPLHIKEIKITSVASAIIAVLISLLGFTGMIIWRKRFFGGFTSREYILIGLYAAVAFTLVSVPSTVAYNIFHALMGPFSFLITGIFSEVIFYLLLMSLAALIPRPGVIFFFIITNFLLSGVILGNFTATSMIFHPAQAVVLELAFFISGLYGKDFGFRLSKSCGLMKLLWAALVFGAADAFLSYITFNLSIFIYRLYYAEWYIMAYVFISGFLYTFISVPLGFKMGVRLRSVAID